MKIYLISVGTSIPSWIVEGFEDYQKRFPRNMPVILKEIPNLKRTKNADTDAIMYKEGQAILKAIGDNAHVVILDIPGKQFDTPQLAQELDKWQYDGRDVYLIIGGPEGLAQEVKERAQQAWSLSKLTMPYALARLVVIEALYRAWTLNNNIPYHRE